MLIPKELVAWWEKHHSLRLHVLFNRKNNNNNNPIIDTPIISILQAKTVLKTSKTLKNTLSKETDFNNLKLYEKS